MNEINFKFKEKRITLFFDIHDTTNKKLYEMIANDLKLEVNKINLINIVNNDQDMDMKYIHEMIIVELLDDSQPLDNSLSKRQNSGYVGLSNPDVYYLNSFLQSLYMIIPFRNLIYSWNWKNFVDLKRERKGELKMKSGVRQLQYLFTELERINAKYIEPYEFFVEKIKTIQYTYPNDFFSSILQVLLPDFQNTQLVSVFLDMFCLRVETNTHKNFASIEIDQNKYDFNEGIVSFFGNITKYISFPQYLFIFPQRFNRDYHHISKNTSQLIYPPNFNLKDLLVRLNQDVNYELLQVAYHKGHHWTSDGFGLVAKNELGEQWLHFTDKTVHTTSKEECFSFFSDNNGEKESAIFLVYKKVENTNVQLTKIPQQLIKDTLKEEKKRQERVMEKIRRRDYSTMSVYLGRVKEGDKPWRLEISENYKNISFNRNSDVSAIAKVAAVEWKISDKEFSFRIRKYNSKYKVAVDSYRDDETFMMSNISVTDNLILEVFPEPNHLFTERKGSCYVLGVTAFNKDNNTFSPLEYIPFETTMQFSELKINLERITGIPSSTMKIYYETNHDSQEKELNYPNKNLRETPLFDGHKLYVEDYDPLLQYSPCLMELENVKNQTEIYYNSNITLNSFEKAEFDKCAKIDKRVSVYDLLQLISMDLGVEVEELKIFNIFERERERVSAEIKNMSLSLTEVVKSKSKVMVYLEKTKQQVTKEAVLSFFYYNPSVFSYLQTSPFQDIVTNENENHNLKPKLYTEAFDLTVQCNITVTDLRKLIFENLDQLKLEKPKSPLHIRLREIYANFPSSIFPNLDKLTLSECCENLFFKNKPIAFQLLEEEEPVVSKNFVVPVLQRWCPSSCTFGPRTELVLDKDMPVEELRNFISKKYNIENVGLAKSIKIEIFHSDMEEFLWDPSVPLFVANKKTKFATLSSSPFFLSDGQILFFRDNKETKPQLGPKEKSKLEIFMKTHKALSLVSRKEKNKK